MPSTYVQDDWHNAPFPSELVWVSKRLTRDKVELRNATHSSYNVSATLSPPFKGPEVKMERRPATTISDYAVRATRVVRADTGTLRMPNDYVRMVLDFHLAIFEVPFAWETPTQERVATLFASQYVHGVGRVFVGLFGSRHNILSLREEETYTGRTPSDARGLYQILHDTREPGEVQLRPEILTDPRELSYSDAARADLAAEVLYGLRDPMPPQTLDVLAQPYGDVVRHHRLSASGAFYDLVVIGTAMWAGKPAKRPDPFIKGEISAARMQLWPVFDERLDDFIDALRHGDNPAVPNEVVSDDPDEWEAFASWFVQLGRHLGHEGAELVADRKPRRLSPRRYLTRDWRNRFDPLPTGIEGYVVRAGDNDYLVSETGAIVRVLSLESMSLYRTRDGDSWLEQGEAPRTLAPGEVPAMQVAMWRQATDWRRNLQSERRSSAGLW